METQTNIARPKLNIGFFFLSLGVLISLITSVVSFLNLVFETLNKRFPDVLNASYEYGYSTYQYDGIRMALATLIIFFPVYLVVSYFWNRHIARGLGLIDEVLKKWLIYIVLFLSSVVVVLDLVTLVRYFISGEITGRFILKVLVTLVVAAVVGVFYILILRGKGSKKLELTFGIIGIAMVLFAIFYSFSIMGSPREQRLLRLDDRRVGDLQNIQYQVINFWQQKEKLPATLEEMVNPLTGYSLPVPPEFEKGEKYEYKVLGRMRFELCATFAAPIPQGWREYDGGVRPFNVIYDKEGMATSYPYPGGGTNESWSHDVGRTCFERTIDRDIYPPFRNF